MDSKTVKTVARKGWARALGDTPGTWGRALFLPCLLACLVPCASGLAADTSLLFVGEDLSVVTVASRRAESPERAPALARVITRAELESHGVRTLGEALSYLPGFFMAPREWGSQPYLRGVADSVLFLYDSVPLTSDSTKSIHPLDEELSLAAIERIEVIQGPGSVLWGPDAFAGIVNIVPRQGRDLEGVEVYTRGGAPNDEGAFAVSWGRNTGLWEAFCSLSGTRLEPRPDRFTVVDFLGKDGSVLPFSERLDPEGAGLDSARYAEAVFNLSWQDWLKLSGRWSDAKRPYVLHNLEGDLSWAVKREAPFRFLRLEATKTLARSSLRLNAYYDELPYKEEQVDLAWVDQKSHVIHFEGLYDREMWASRGLMTVGASYRRNRITGAPIRKDFLPDLLQPENLAFNALLEKEDFNTSLRSVFAQYRYHWDRFDVWGGLRLDGHSQYSETVSYNLGLAWFPSPAWRLKLLLGTAYRTPYNQQLVGKEGLDPEEVQSLSAELALKPTAAWRITVAPFWNRIRHHIQEDPAGGLSLPGEESLAGLEFALTWKPASAVHLWANATYIAHSGDDESYRDTFTISSLVSTSPPVFVNRDVEVNWDVPFDAGPKSLLNVGFSWQPVPRWDFGMRLYYAGTRRSGYLVGVDYPSLLSGGDSMSGPVEVVTAEPIWLLDAAITVHRFPWGGADLQIAAKNLLDEGYETPGTYSLIDGTPLAIYVALKWRF